MVFSQDLVIGGHSSPIYCLDISEGGYLYSGAGDRFLAKWNLKTGLQEKFSIQFDSAVYCIQRIPSTPYIAVGLHNGNIHIINLDENKEERLLKMTSSSVFTLNYSEQHQLLFATSGDSKLGIWHVPSFESYQMIQFSSGKLRSSLLLKDEIVLGCQTGEIRRVNFLDIKETARFQSHADSVNTLIYWAEKDSIISGGKDATINFNNLNKQEVSYQIEAHNFSVYELLISEKILISGSMDKSIKVWDLSNLELIKKLSRPEYTYHKRSINTLVEDFKNNCFYSAGDDGVIAKWSIK